MKKIFLLVMTATAFLFTSCQKEFTIIVMPCDANMGITSGSGTYVKGMEIEIAALPQSGYKFVKWNDENTNNPRRVTVNKDETYTAVFKRDINNHMIIDGMESPILMAGFDEDDFNEGHYNIILFLSDVVGVKIMADKAHHDGRTIDLTQKEPEHDGWYWSVECYLPELIFDTYGEPNTSYPVFISGTLYVKHIGTSNGKPVFEILIENGKVKGEGEYGDGKIHTIELHYKGELSLDDY